MNDLFRELENVLGYTRHASVVYTGGLDESCRTPMLSGGMISFVETTLFFEGSTEIFSFAINFPG